MGTYYYGKIECFYEPEEPGSKPFWAEAQPFWAEVATFDFCKDYGLADMLYTMHPLPTEPGELNKLLEEMRAHKDEDDRLIAVLNTGEFYAVVLALDAKTQEPDDPPEPSIKVRAALAAMQMVERERRARIIFWADQ